MAEIIGRPNVDLRLTFSINESEARALDALAGYGDDAFVKAFYDNLGKAYMQDHEQGLRTFLRSIREMLPQWLSRLSDARKAFNGKPKEASNGE